jgi:hypothetical protein
MKRVFRIFELSKSEQRVVLIVMFLLLAVSFLRYERRVHHGHVHVTIVPEVKISPTPVQAGAEQ